MALSTFATGTITCPVNASAGDLLFFTGGVTYTFRASVGSTANEILIGGTRFATLQNIADAINGTPAKSGVTFGSGTVFNPEIRAFYIGGSNLLTIQSRMPGVIGNRLSFGNSPGNHVSGSGSLAGGSGSLDLDLLGNIQTMQIPASILEVLMRILTGIEISP